jgi:hypothetical protein
MALRALFDNMSLPELGANLQLLYAASAQKQLLARIDTSLVLEAGELINTISGESRRLLTVEGSTWEEQLAQTARLLIPDVRKTSTILLLLPSSYFIATRFDLNISGEKLLKSALRLQAPTLLPAYERPLQLALSGAKQQGQKSQGIALWYPQAAADGLYQSFAAHGLQLAALQPRVLGAAAAEPLAAPQLLLDEDAEHTTLAELEQGVLKNWLSVHKLDLENELFRQQWQNELNKLETPQHQDLLRLDRRYWGEQRRLVTPHEAYCFYPAGAIQSGKTLLARKQRKAGAFAAAALILVLALPFISNWAQIAWLDHQVAVYQELSTEARQSQSAVYALEDAWGAVAEYPQQDIGGILLSLNQYIESSLSSFNINKGVIDISGYSQDPALLIEQLAELEMFYDVGQSRSSSGGNDASRGDRFGIRMNVTGVDFPAYEENYPATQQ